MFKLILSLLLLLIVSFGGNTLHAQGLSIGVRVGTAIEAPTYDELQMFRAGARVEMLDGKYYALTGDVRLNRFLSLSTELGYFERGFKMTQQKRVIPDSALFVNIARNYKHKGLDIPLLLKVRFQKKFLGFYGTIGFSAAKYLNTVEETLDAADGKRLSTIALPAPFRNNHWQATANIGGGLQISLGRISILTDLRFTRSMKSFSDDYSIANLPDSPAKINSFFGSFGLTFNLF
jgi:hypothetical protein